MSDDDSNVPTARGRAADDPGEMPPPRLFVGEPFALAYDCELRGASSDNTNTIVVECKCGKPFRMQLLEAGNKPCPHGCGNEYTHLLLVCNVDNDQAFCGVLEQIADVNPVDGEQGDDAGDDDQGDDDDDQGDDDDDDQGDDQGDDGR